MKRIFFCFVLFALAFSYRGIVGLILKTAARTEDCCVAYRNLRFDHGLVLEDGVLFGPDYLIRSEKITIQWPFHISILRPHVRLSKDIFKKGEEKPNRWSIEIEEGTLEWTQNEWPQSQFSLKIGPVSKCTSHSWS